MIASMLLILTAPLFLIAVLGILISSPGPAFYRAARVGQGGSTFEMLKFRSMHVSAGGAVITAYGDPRIFSFGKVLRKLKIDELPQFLNVLRGDMAIVGPRPEDPKIVREHYTDWMRKTLDVPPGITSAGAIFYYGYGENMISDDDPEGSYVQAFLPAKLAIERAYLERATLVSDMVVMLRTILAILGAAAGIAVAPDRRDITRARHWVDAPIFGRLT